MWIKSEIKGNFESEMIRKKSRMTNDYEFKGEGLKLSKKQGV